jgi:hypothetical protein
VLTGTSLMEFAGTALYRTRARGWPDERRSFRARRQGRRASLRPISATPGTLHRLVVTG